MFTLKDFNFSSDIHIDFYEDKLRLENVSSYFMEGIPKASTLVLAGDLANDNEDSIRLLETLLNAWETVILVDGNHDWYGDFGITIEDGRWASLKEYFKKESRLVFLGADTGVLESSDGFKLAGANMWYDLDRPEVLISAMVYMNDGRMIGIDKMEKLAKEELAFYNKVIGDVDLFVSHVPLVDQFHGQGYADKCYYRNVKLLENKVYLSGHMHEGYSMTLQNMTFLSKPIGYDFSGKRFGYFDMETKEFL